MINIPDIVGWTPIHIACYYKRKEIVLLLLKNSANLFFKDREGLYPYNLIANDQSCTEAINSYLMYIQNNKNNVRNSVEYEEKNTEINNETNQNNLLTYSKNEHFFKKYFYKQKQISCKNENDAKNFSFTEQNMQDFIKLSDANEKIFESYKFIPKKPKFYLNYKSFQNLNDIRLGSSINFNHDLKNKILNFTNLSTSILKTPKMNKSNTFYNNSSTSKKNFEYIENLEQNKANNILKISTTNISIKLPKAFPTTKNIGILIGSSAKINKFCFDEFIEDSEKTIVYNDTLENEYFEDNKINKIKDKNFKEDSIEYDKNDAMIENNINLNMLGSEESEDSFIIDFDISFNEDLAKVSQKKNLTKKERRAKNKSWIEKVKPQKEVKYKN